MVIDRKKLGQIVFADPEKLKRLEAIVHPELRQSINRCFDSAKKDDRAVIVIQHPLVFEMGDAEQYDRVIAVGCQPSTQMGRLLFIRHLDPTQAEQRVATQIPLLQKMSMADYVIWTNGLLAHTHCQTEAIWSHLLFLAGQAFAIQKGRNDQ